jgi:hypothetical protein
MAGSVSRRVLAGCACGFIDLAGQQSALRVKALDLSAQTQKQAGSFVRNSTVVCIA